MNGTSLANDDSQSIRLTSVASLPVTVSKTGSSYISVSGGSGSILTGTSVYSGASFQVSSTAPASTNQSATFSGGGTGLTTGTQGSTTNVRTREYKDGPNFDQRHESKECVLYAIRNGGFSSGPMPQNIITGEEAKLVAEFLQKYSKAAPVGGDIPDCPATQ